MDTNILKKPIASIFRAEEFYPEDGNNMLFRWVNTDPTELNGVTLTVM
jgi:hypothetical protein